MPRTRAEDWEAAAETRSSLARATPREPVGQTVRNNLWKGPLRNGGSFSFAQLAVLGLDMRAKFVVHGRNIGKRILTSVRIRSIIGVLVILLREEVSPFSAVSVPVCQVHNASV